MQPAPTTNIKPSSPPRVSPMGASYRPADASRPGAGIFLDRFWGLAASAWPLTRPARARSCVTAHSRRKPREVSPRRVSSSSLSAAAARPAVRVTPLPEAASRGSRWEGAPASRVVREPAPGRAWPEASRRAHRVAARLVVPARSADPVGRSRAVRGLTPAERTRVVLRRAVALRSAAAARPAAPAVDSLTTASA